MFDPNNKMLIAMAEGTSKNIKMKPRNLSFKEFGEFCSKCQKGGKHESYFTRGLPDIEEEYQSKSGREYYNGRFRHDSSIPKGDFLIIDADNSVASPEEVHKILKDKEYAHFIYTSHSHSADSNNFRVVLPCSISSKKYMVATAKAIIEEIEDVDYVREMGVWSQAWYLPTRDDIEDGVFEYFEYMDGTEFIQVEVEQKVESKGSGNMSDAVEDVQTMAQMIQVITTGGEGMHHAMKSYSYGAVQDGQNKTVVKETLRGLMMAVPNRDSRWQTRFDDIDRLVDGVEEPDSAEVDLVAPELSPISKAVKEVVIEWPPGEFGELCKAVYKYSDYPNRIISIVTALGLVAGVMGRRFNVNGTGLNLYLSLLMNTGKGKKVIGQFINRVLNDASIFSGSATFVGSRRYTGPKALMDLIYVKRCLVSVFTEAGMMFSSTAGDKSGLTRSILDLYGLSGQHDWTEEETYSDGKNSIPAVQGACFSMVNESTPDVFLQALREGTKTGEITRMNIFRTALEDYKINRNKEYLVKDELLLRIKKISSHCGSTQAQNDAKASDFIVTDAMWDFADELTKESEEYADSDEIRSNMLSRAGLKTWKVACLISAFNSVDIKSLKDGARQDLAVDEDAWGWSKSLHEYEMDGLEDFFRVEGADNLDKIVESEMLYRIVKLIQPKGCTDKEYSQKWRLTAQEKKKNKIPWSKIRKACENCRVITDLNNAKQGKVGLKEVLFYMNRSGYIKYKEFDGYFIVKQVFFDTFSA